MARFCSILLWTAVFLLLLAGLDQLLVRLPARYPAHVAVATFYRDLRTRIVDLARESKPPLPAPVAAPAKSSPPGKGQRENAGSAPSIEGVIGRHQAQPAAPVADRPVAKAVGAAETRPRYIYADAGGELHFADTLAEIPEEYREKAKLLGE